MSLYLKYRPQDFQSVVGQEALKKTLQAAFLNDTVSHAYLFSGPRGTGKTSMARIVAKRLNCLNPQNNEACRECEICKAIQEGRLVDLIEIDAASNRGIDEIRELREKIVFTPTQARTKVYIIDEVHMLTKEAFNALLKTLEEPPSHAYFILATTEVHKIPETIISRCQQFSLSRIEVKDITDRLQYITEAEGGQADLDALELIAKLSNGGLRDAIGLLEQMLLTGKVTVEGVNQQLGLTGKTHLQQFFASLLAQNSTEALNLLKAIKTQGQSLAQFLKEAIHLMREELHRSLNDAQRSGQIMEMIETFLKAKSQLDLSPIPELPLEMAILKCCGFKPFIPQEIQQSPQTIELKKTQLEIKDLKTELKPKKTEIQNQEDPSKQSPVTLTLDQIKAEWPRVVEQIPTAFIKMSLNDSEPTHIEEGVLTLSFKSASFKEKIDAAVSQKEVLEALEKVFNQSFSLKLEVKKIQLSDLQKKDAAPQSADLAAEVFGING